MRLRRQTIITFLVAVGSTLALNTLVVVLLTNWRMAEDRRELAAGIDRIHGQFAAQYAARVNFAIASDARALSILTQSFATWDVVYDYIATRDPITFDENFSDQGMLMTDIDVVVLTDQRGKVIVARAFPPGGRNAAVDIPPDETAAIHPGGLRESGAGGGTSGLSMHNGTPLLLAVRPVLRSDGGGPIAGTLAFGKYLGGIWQKTAAAASKIDFSLEVRDGESLPAEAGLALAAGNPLWIEPVPQNLWADGALRPTRLAAAVETELEPRRLAIVASIPPDLLAEEKRLLERQETEIRLIMVLFLIGLVAGGAAMSVPLLVMVQRGITRPVHLMEQAALVVAADPERHGSLPLVGSDELKDISRAVNVMLSELSAKRRDLMLANQALDASLLPVIVTDMARNILMVNGAFTRMYGFQPHEAIGKNPNFLNPGKETYGDTGIGENEFELLFGGLRAFYESGASQWEGMLFNRKADGSVIPCQVVISSIMASKGPIGYVGWTIDLSKRIRAEQEVRIEVYQALSDLAEQRDNETGMHIKRLGIASAELAGQIKLSPHFVEEMALFAPLHDIGKVGIQDAILLAPRKLAGDEFKVMSTHAYIGYTILAEKKTMQTAAEIAWCHHERWDGTGYPRGLAGEDIPLSARIVAVIDVYDALRSHRPYKEPWSHEQAVEYVVSAAGSHFDPDIVAIFERGNEKFRAIFDANS